jgi:hypothetical protein
MQASKGWVTPSGAQPGFDVGSNVQRNRAATVDVYFNFRVIRRSGSRDCSVLS